MATDAGLGFGQIIKLLGGDPVAMSGSSQASTFPTVHAEFSAAGPITARMSLRSKAKVLRGPTSQILTAFMEAEPAEGMKAALS